VGVLSQGVFVCTPARSMQSRLASLGRRRRRDLKIAANRHRPSRRRLRDRWCEINTEFLVCGPTAVAIHSWR